CDARFATSSRRPRRRTTDAGAPFVRGSARSAPLQAGACADFPPPVAECTMQSVETIAGSVAERRAGLLEREHELSSLATALASVRAGERGRLVLLCGEAGVGKTAVIQSFRATHGEAA